MASGDDQRDAPAARSRSATHTLLAPGTLLAPATLLAALLLGVYFLLPAGDQDNDSDAGGGSDGASDARKPEILAVKPVDPYPGSSLVVTYGEMPDAARLHVYAGKEELKVLMRRPGAIVAQLPSDAEPGNLKIRLAIADELGEVRSPSERSKPYHVRVKAVRWRKAFRNLIGGIALLVLGINMLSRGARESTGIDGARRLAQASRRSVPALALGSLIGALAQSTTAAAGVLSGLVGSSVLGVAPAATAFLGAQIGAALAPLLVSGLLEPHDGLLVIALGVLWNGLARDRRAKAFARLVLGAGFIAYGIEVLRPGLEPLAAHPMLLSLGDQLRAQGAIGLIQCALLGAGLVAVLQGPAPVLMLMLAVAHTTGHRDLRTALALLAGSGIGAALSALLTLPRGERGRELAWLYLILGGLSSVLVASTVDVWSALAHYLLRAENAGPGAPALAAQGNTWALALSFMASQFVAALVLLPLVPRLARWLAPAPASDHAQGASLTVDVQAMRARLLHALAAQRAGLSALFELALTGARSEGRVAEHSLGAAREALEAHLRAPLSEPSVDLETERLTSVAFGSLQVQRALEALLLEVERLTDSRLGESESESDRDASAIAGGADEAPLREMQELLSHGLQLVAEAIRAGVALELELARAREIQMNMVESRARAALLADQRKIGSEQRRFGLLKVIDGYESAGNQVYRLAELLGELYEPSALPAVPVSQPEGRYET
jgi:Na+/phosphate symporter